MQGGGSMLQGERGEGGVFTYLNSHQTEDKMSSKNHQFGSPAVLKPTKNPDNVKTKILLIVKEQEGKKEIQTRAFEGTTVEKRNNDRTACRCSNPQARAT